MKLFSWRNLLIYAVAAVIMVMWSLEEKKTDGQWDFEISKEKCTWFYIMGLEKGRQDRRLGVRDKNASDEVKVLIPLTIETATYRAEAELCYDQGYEDGFFARRTVSLK